MSEPGDEQRRLDRISQYRELSLLTLQAELRDADALQAHIGALLDRLLHYVAWRLDSIEDRLDRLEQEPELVSE